MREITNKTELAEFFRDILLPYYEQHYREDLTRDDADRLRIDLGLCLCAHHKFKVKFDGIMADILGHSGLIIKKTMAKYYTAKESLLPRIEWMKQFINDNLPCSSPQTKE